MDKPMDMAAPGLVDVVEAVAVLVVLVVEVVEVEETVSRRLSLVTRSANFTDVRGSECGLAVLYEFATERLTLLPL